MLFWKRLNKERKSSFYIYFVRAWRSFPAANRLAAQLPVTIHFLKVEQTVQQGMVFAGRVLTASVGQMQQSHWKNLWWKNAQSRPRITMSSMDNIEF